ncbi:hypothetical protein QTP88_002730 [Uroleucon formosanum]
MCVFNLISAPLVVQCMVDDWSDVLLTSLTVLQSRPVQIVFYRDLIDVSIVHAVDELHKTVQHVLQTPRRVPIGDAFSSFTLFHYVFDRKRFRQSVFHCLLRDINDDENRMKIEHIDFGRFPFFGKATDDLWSNTAPSSKSCVVAYDKDFYCPKDKANPLTNVVEILKIRH